MSSDYDPRNWYWVVGSDQTRVYSSASGTFVPVSDPTFTAWLAAGNVAPTLGTIGELGALLVPYRLRPVDVGALAAYQAGAASAVDLVLARVLFNHENRIRSLEAKAPVTAQQFTAALAALL